MRETVKEKISYFFEDRISYLQKIHRELAISEFDFEMISINLTKKESIIENGIMRINLTESINHNNKLIISEILEDFMCSLDLIKNAYFKQSSQVIRNTLELMTMLLYLNNNLEESKDWIYEERGIEKIFKMTTRIKNQVDAELKPLISEIEKFYNLLNRPTHSHKQNLNVKGIHKFDVMGVFGFEYSSFHNSYLINLCCLSIFLKIYKNLIDNIPDVDLFKNQLQKRITYISSLLNVFDNDIICFKKGDYERGSGYLIYKKHMTINNIQLLYSYTSDNKIIWNSKNKGLQKDSKLIFTEIDKYFIKKLTII